MLVRNSVRVLAFGTSTTTEDVSVVEFVTIMFVLDVVDPSTNGVHFSERPVQGFEEEVDGLLVRPLNGMSEIGNRWRDIETYELVEFLLCYSWRGLSVGGRRVLAVENFFRRLVLARELAVLSAAAPQLLLEHSDFGNELGACWADHTVGREDTRAGYSFE